MHVVLALPSAAFPEQFGLDGADCAADGFSDCAMGGAVGKALTDTEELVGRNDENDESEGSGGIRVGYRRLATLSGGSWWGFTILSGRYLGLRTTFLTFNYRILSAANDGSPGFSLWEMVSTVIRWGFTAVQIVVGLRIILALRGSG